MDLLTALRYYYGAYSAHATQLCTRRIAREWMESMPGLRQATSEDLEAHAVCAAAWASAGYLPSEALPLIEAGMTPEMAVAMDPEPERRMEYLADRIKMLENED